MFLSENSLYTDQTEQDALLKDHDKLVDAFYANFLGFLSLKKISPKDNVLQNYFRTGGSVRLNQMNDTNNDLSLVVKLMADAKRITDNTATRITKLLALLKQDKIDTINEQIIRDILTLVNVTKNRPKNPIIRKVLDDFMKADINLSQAGKDLFVYSRRNKINTEFVKQGKRFTQHWGVGDDANDSNTPIPVTPQQTTSIAQTPQQGPRLATVAGHKQLSPGVKLMPDGTLVRKRGRPSKADQQAIAALQQTGQNTLATASLVKASDAPSQPQTPVQLVKYLIVDPKVAPETGAFQRTILLNYLWDKPKAEIEQALRNASIGSAGDKNDIIQRYFSGTSVGGLWPNLRNPAKTYNINSPTLKPIWDKFKSLVHVDDLKITKYQRDNFFVVFKAPVFLAKNDFDPFNFNDIQYWQKAYKSGYASQISPYAGLIHDRIEDVLSNKFVKWIDFIKDNIGSTTNFHFMNFLINVFSYANIGTNWNTRYLEILRDLPDSDILHLYNRDVFSKENTDKTVLILNSAILSYTTDIVTVVRAKLLKLGILDKFVPLSDKEFIATRGKDELARKVFNDKYGSMYGSLASFMQIITGPDFSAESVSDFITKYNLYNDLVQKVIEFNSAETVSLILSYGSNWGLSDEYMEKLLTDNRVIDFYGKSTVTYKSDVPSTFVLYHADMIWDFFEEVMGKGSVSQGALSCMITFLARQSSWDPIGNGFSLDDILPNPGLYKNIIDAWIDMVNAYPHEVHVLNYVMKMIPPEYFDIKVFKTQFINYTSSFLPSYIKTWNKLPFRAEALDNLKTDLFSTSPYSKYRYLQLLLILFQLVPTGDSEMDTKLKSLFMSMANDNEITLTQIFELYEETEKNGKAEMAALASTVYKDKVLKDPLGLLVRIDLYSIRKQFPLLKRILGTDKIIDLLLPRTSGLDLRQDFTNLQGLYDAMETDDERLSFITKNKEVFQKQHRISKYLSEFSIGQLAESLLTRADAEEKVTKLIEALSVNRAGKDRSTVILNAIIADRATIQVIGDLSKDLHTKLSPQALKELLRFNNFTYDSSKFGGKKKKETYVQYLKRINVDHAKIPKIQGTLVEETNEDKEKKAVEYTKYYNNKHGRLGVIFLESYDIRMETDEFKEFIKTHPEPTVIPAFHGTGTIAANMILRFGFKIVTRDIGGVATTGKMLGNGVYFSNVLSKSIQYVGDSGYGRNVGTIGYILEMDAYIGQNGIDYKSAGVPGDSTGGIRSAEWCVFNPRAQLKITKAHKVKLVNEDDISALKRKHPGAIKENRYFARFKDFIRLDEANMTQKPDTLIYIFYDGMIPVAADKAIEFTEFEKKYGNNKILVDPSQKGPSVSLKIQTTEPAGFVHVPDTDRFLQEDPDGLCSKFLTLIEKLK